MKKNPYQILLLRPFITFLFLFLFLFLFGTGWLIPIGKAQTTTPPQVPLRLVLLENSDQSEEETRTHYPLLISETRGYRIRCLNQMDEEEIIRGLGFLIIPSVILSPLDPVILAARPTQQPFLCPQSNQYPIKLYRHNSGTGEKFYLQFPVQFTHPQETDPAGPAYGNALYTIGCSGLLKALRLDPSTAINADPTPFFGGRIFPIQCAKGDPITVKTNAFKEWCLKKDLNSWQKSAVETLMDRTPQGREAMGDPMGCQDADDFLNKLPALSLKNAELYNIEPLAALKNLTKLNLAGNDPRDLRPLAELTNLTSLDFSGCPIAKHAKIAHLASLTKLTELNLSHTMVSDLTVLASLTSLETLNLTGNYVTDGVLDALTSFPGLKNLYLSHNVIVNPSPLKRLSSLVNLDLSFNKIPVATYLKGFPQTTKILSQNNPFNTDSDPRSEEEEEEARRLEEARRREEEEARRRGREGRG